MPFNVFDEFNFCKYSLPVSLHGIFHGYLRGSHLLEEMATLNAEFAGRKRWKEGEGEERVGRNEGGSKVGRVAVYTCA